MGMPHSAKPEEIKLDMTHIELIILLCLWDGWEKSLSRQLDLSN